MNLLLTGFEPFENETCNPSMEAVSRLDGLGAEINIKRVILPVVFGKATDRLLEEIRSFHPDVVLSVGLAGQRRGVSVERIAVNLADARIADNEGNMPQDEILEPSGETAYFSNLPVKEMAKAIRKEGVEVQLSNTAGLFVCNSVMYAALHYAKTKENGMRAGFIHLPYLPAQVRDKAEGTPFLSLEEDIRALRASIGAIR